MDFSRAIPLGRVPTPEEVEHLIGTYRGQFALGLLPTRNGRSHIETRCTRPICTWSREASGRGDMATGHWDRGIVTARSALSVDPQAEHVEASLSGSSVLAALTRRLQSIRSLFERVLKEGLGSSRLLWMHYEE